MTRAKQGNFEAGLSKLAEIVEALEKGEATLEEAVTLYEQGLAQAKQCRKALDKARHRITVSQGGQVRDFATPDVSEDNGADHGDP